MSAVKTVLWGMIGVRRKADHEGQRVHPLQLIAAGLALAALFIFTLLTIVRIVTG